MLLTHYQMTNFRLFQTERVCRRHFKFDENGRKLSEWVENTVGKGQNCLLRAISPFPTVFSKGLFPRASKGVIVWEWVKGAFGELYNIFKDKFDKILSQQ